MYMTTPTKLQGRGSNMAPEIIQEVDRQLYHDRATIRSVCKALGVARNTLFDHLRKRGLTITLRVVPIPRDEKVIEAISHNDQQVS